MSIDVLLLRGAPGSGKSTLAARLREHQALRRGAVIEVDQLRSMVTRVDWTDQAVHAAAVAMAVDGALLLRRAGVGPVVIVDTFAWSSLAGAQARLAAAGLQHATLSLWVRGRELGRRLSERTRGYRDLAGALSINAAIADSELRSREWLLDASDLEPAKVEEVAIAVLGGMTEAGASLDAIG